MIDGDRGGSHNILLDSTSGTFVQPPTRYFDGCTWLHTHPIQFHPHDARAGPHSRHMLAR